METTAKGKGLLKVVGILMIIGGALGLVLSIITILGIAALALAGASAPLLYAAAIISIACAAVELTAGIIGVKNCANVAAASKCLAWGIVVAVLSVLGSVLSVIGGDKLNVLNLLLGLVLPVLYIIGAIKNKA